MGDGRKKYHRPVMDDHDLVLANPMGDHWRFPSFFLLGDCFVRRDFFKGLGL